MVSRRFNLPTEVQGANELPQMDCLTTARYVGWWFSVSLEPHRGFMQNQERSDWASLKTTRWGPWDGVYKLKKQYHNGWYKCQWLFGRFWTGSDDHFNRWGENCREAGLWWNLIIPEKINSIHMCNGSTSKIFQPSVNVFDKGSWPNPIIASFISLKGRDCISCIHNNLFKQRLVVLSRS